MQLQNAKKTPVALKSVKVDDKFDCISPEAVQEDFTCLICLNIVIDPVSCVACETLFCG